MQQTDRFYVGCDCRLQLRKKWGKGNIVAIIDFVFSEGQTARFAAIEAHVESVTVVGVEDISPARAAFPSTWLFDLET